MSENQDPSMPQPPNVPPPGDVPPPPPPIDYAATGTPPDKDARTWGMLAHLSALAGYIIPFGNLLGPLVVWLVKREEMPFVNDQGKESLNFQITMTIALLICAALICVFIGFILLPIVGIIDLVFIIIAAIKANSGVVYRYPFTLRLVK
jgi:uncharacterized Tic20 family protein